MHTVSPLRFYMVLLTDWPQSCACVAMAIMAAHAYAYQLGLSYECDMTPHLPHMPNAHCPNPKS